MSQGTNILDRIQDDVFAVLKYAPAFAEANVIKADDGDIEAKVARAIATLEGGRGKIGLAMVVLQTEVVESAANLPGPTLGIQQEIQVIEHPLMNRGATGTGVRCSAAALTVLGALHLHCVGDLLLFAEKDPVKPFKVKPGFVSHVVTLKVRNAGLDPVEKPADVAASISGTDATLTCATSGAAIWFTADGSYPAPDNEEATQYSAPFTVELGTWIRAAAYKTGLHAGNATEFRRLA